MKRKAYALLFLLEISDNLEKLLLCFFIPGLTTYPAFAALLSPLALATPFPLARRTIIRKCQSFVSF